MSATSLLAYRTQACMPCTQKLSVLEVESFNMNYLKKLGFNIMRGFRNMTSETSTAKDTKATLFILARNLTREFHFSLHRSETRTQKKEGFFHLDDRGEHSCKKNCLIQNNHASKLFIYFCRSLPLFSIIFLSASVSRDDRTLNGANKKEHKKIFFPREKLRKNPA
jgi:hypothetical protein